MPRSRRRAKLRRGDDIAEAKAWSRFFDTGYDFLGELLPYGVDARCHAGERGDEVMTAARKAWRRFGTAYLHWILARGGDVSNIWALSEFGEPSKCR